VKYVSQLLLTVIVTIVLLLGLLGIFIGLEKDLGGLSSLVLLIGIVIVGLYVFSRYVSWITSK